MNNNLLEITKTNSDCAQYTGTVTVASYLGDRLIQKETQHNAGLKTLFEFISSCLQGNWYEAKNKRPCKLIMLKQATDEILTDEEYNSLPISERPAGGKSTPANDDATDGQNNHYWGAKYTVCSPIMYDTAAVAENSDAESSVTYHFRIPFLNLVGGSTIKKLMLLPPLTSDYRAEACAYFVLDNPIKVPVASANFTIIIDWTLTFNNSTTD